MNLLPYWKGNTVFCISTIVVYTSLNQFMSQQLVQDEDESGSEDESEVNLWMQAKKEKSRKWDETPVVHKLFIICGNLLVLFLICWGLYWFLDLGWEDEPPEPGREWEVKGDDWLLLSDQTTGSILNVTLSDVVLNLEPRDSITIDWIHAEELYTGIRIHTYCYESQSANGETYTTCYDVSYYRIGLTADVAGLNLDIIGTATFVEDCFRENCTMIVEVKYLTDDSALVVLRDYEVIVDV